MSRVRRLSSVNATARALLAVVIGVLVLGAYLVLLRTQGGNAAGGREVFFVGYWSTLATAGVFGGVSITSKPDTGQVILYAVATGYLASGVLAILTIGAPLLVAAVLAISAAGPLRPRPIANILAIVLPVALLILGVGVTT